jgi:hypothetical protein
VGARTRCWLIDLLPRAAVEGARRRSARLPAARSVLQRRNASDTVDLLNACALARRGAQVARHSQQRRVPFRVCRTNQRVRSQLLWHCDDAGAYRVDDCVAVPSRCYLLGRGLLQGVLQRV